MVRGGVLFSSFFHSWQLPLVVSATPLSGVCSPWEFCWFPLGNASAVDTLEPPLPCRRGWCRPGPLSAASARELWAAWRGQTWARGVFGPAWFHCLLFAISLAPVQCGVAVSSGSLLTLRQAWRPDRLVRSEVQPSSSGTWRDCPHTRCLPCHPRLGLSNTCWKKEMQLLGLLLIFLFCFDWFCYLLSFYIQNSHRESDGSVTI